MKTSGAMCLVPEVVEPYGVGSGFNIHGKIPHRTNLALTPLSYWSFSQLIAAAIWVGCTLSSNYDSEAVVSVYQLWVKVNYDAHFEESFLLGS